VLHGRRGTPAVSRQLGDPGLPDLDERELGGHEESIERDEEEGRAESPGDTEQVEGRVRVGHRARVRSRADARGLASESRGSLAPSIIQLPLEGATVAWPGEGAAVARPRADESRRRVDRQGPRGPAPRIGSHRPPDFKKGGDDEP
jgi:hypothetical protein